MNTQTLEQVLVTLTERADPEEFAEPERQAYDALKRLYENRRGESFAGVYSRGDLLAFHQNGGSHFEED